MSTPENSIQHLYRDRVEWALERLVKQPILAEDDTNLTLNQSILYVLNGDGKRFRPALVYATGETFGASLEDLDSAACAIELVHLYSLVHDDLPCMDDANTRQGQLCCHRLYDVATAVMTGNALQSLAFELISSDEAFKSGIRCEMMKILSQYALYQHYYFVFVWVV